MAFPMPPRRACNGRWVALPACSINSHPKAQGLRVKFSRQCQMCPKNISHWRPCSPRKTASLMKASCGRPRSQAIRFGLSEIRQAFVSGSICPSRPLPCKTRSIRCKRLIHSSVKFSWLRKWSSDRGRKMAGRSRPDLPRNLVVVGRSFVSTAPVRAFQADVHGQTVNPVQAMSLRLGCVGAFSLVLRCSHALWFHLSASEHHRGPSPFLLAPSPRKYPSARSNAAEAPQSAFASSAASLPPHR